MIHKRFQTDYVQRKCSFSIFIIYFSEYQSHGVNSDGVFINMALAVMILLTLTFDALSTTFYFISSCKNRNLHLHGPGIWSCQIDPIRTE